MMLSPPGRLSITTGLPQRVDSFSWIRRAPMSAPAPGPNGMMNFRGRCGQACAGVCACVRVASKAGAARNAVANACRLVNLVNVSSRGELDSWSSFPSDSRLVEPAQRSLRGLLVAALMDRRNLGALLLDRRGKFLGRAQPRRGADADHARAEGRVGDDRAGIGRDARLDLGRH